MDDINRSGTIQKVGQYPSLADVANDESAKYRTLLPKEDASELHMAIGLAAHGVGVGSLVYLRRVLERLVYRIFHKNEDVENWKIEEFTRLRMGEKIRYLADYLPEFLTENPRIYAILSKGVHELTDEECRLYFSSLKTALIIILDEELERKRREEQRILLSREIALIPLTSSANSGETEYSDRNGGGRDC